MRLGDTRARGDYDEWVLGERRRRSLQSIVLGQPSHDTRFQMSAKVVGQRQQPMQISCGNDRQQILRVLQEMSLNFPRSFMFAKIAKPACPAVDRSRRAGASSPSLRNLGSWDPQKSEFQGQEHRAAAPGPSSRASQNSTCMHSWTLRE